MWKSYLRRWFVRWREAIWNLRKDVIALFVAIVVLIVQFKTGWIKQGTGWEATFINIGPTLGVLVLFLLYHAVAAVVRVDLDREGEIQSLASILSASCDEWPQRITILDLLYDALTEGVRLIELYKTKHPNIAELIRNWDDVVEKRLLTHIGEEYRRIYYEGRKGEPSYMPNEPAEWEQWIRDRNNKLRQFISEFRETPPTLKSLQLKRRARG